jgi:hypothetical protein
MPQGRASAQIGNLATGIEKQRYLNDLASPCDIAPCDIARARPKKRQKTVDPRSRCAAGDRTQIGPDRQRLDEAAPAKFPQNRRPPPPQHPSREPIKRRRGISAP